MSRVKLFTFLLGMSVMCGCSKPASTSPTPPLPPATHVGGNDWSERDADAVKAAAETGAASAQREWAGRLLFGQGVPQDIPAALKWTEKAAQGGDAQAAVWMGRQLLEEPQRVRAAAWFIIAAESGQPGPVQDARVELEALAPTPEELSSARTLTRELQQTFIRPSADESK